MESAGREAQDEQLPVAAETPSARQVSQRSEEHTSELQSQSNLVCRLLLENKIVIVAGPFVLHFLLLLSADLPRQPRLLARVAWFTLAIRLVGLVRLGAPDCSR